MEVYILDSSLRRIEVVEQFESFIWTERYSTPGDFVLEIQPVLAEAALSSKGTLIGCDKSDRTMVVENIESKLSDEGVRVLKITGPSIESVIERRLNDYSKIGVALPFTAITLTGLPGTLMWDLFYQACINNTVIPAENLPGIQTTTYSSTTGAIAMPSTSVTITTEIGPLIDTFKQLSDTYRLGYRIIRVEDPTGATTPKLYFEVYTGFDRTTTQTARPAVVFSVLLDNLTDTQEVTTISEFKNVAYVFGLNGTATVYEEFTDSSIAGFERRSLFVDAKDITLAAGAPLTAVLEQRGREALAANRAIYAFDGKISQTSGLEYGTSYKLGDLVEQRSEMGNRSVMKVTEQIFTSDASGEKSYPTLTLDSLVISGSWDAAPPAKHWDDYTTETWDSM